MAGSGHYGTYNGFDLSWLDYTISHMPIYSEGVVVRYDKVIRFSTHIKYATWAAYNHGTTGAAKLIAALNTPGQDFTIKDQSANTLWDFTAADCIGDGPTVKATVRDQVRYNFFLDIEITGGVEPEGGSGTPVDTYTDRYSWDKQYRKTWTRSGTRRVTTAWSDDDAALEAVKPSGLANWEYLDRDGELDEEGKTLTYNYRFIEYFKKLPSQFADLTMALQEQRNGLANVFAFVASAGIEHGKGVNTLKDAFIKWAKAQIPKNGKISDINSNFNERDGQCSVTISGTAPITGDIVAKGETITEERRADIKVHKRLGGGGMWIQTIGDEDVIRRAEGFIVGLNSHPAHKQSGPNSRVVRHPPEYGPDGPLLYRVSYMHEYIEGAGTIGSPGGGGAGPGGGGAGGGSGGFGTGRDVNTITVGDIPSMGFSFTATPGALTIGNVSGFGGG